LARRRREIGRGRTLSFEFGLAPLSAKRLRFAAETRHMKKELITRPWKQL